MASIAPNTSILIGSRVAALLMGITGGLINLSRIPACNLSVIGQERNKQLQGLSYQASMPHCGVLFQCDLVQKLPNFMRKKALKVVAAKLALATRVDAYKNHPDGKVLMLCTLRQMLLC